MNPAQTIINKLDLKPNVEGGYYKETYKSGVKLQVNEHKIRAINTAIYYLLESDDFSCWHRLTSDEIWHYYSGSSLTLHQLTEQGELSQVILGNPSEHENAVPQHNIPAGIWFAASVNQENSYTLTGCTVSPGFDYDDFEIGLRNDLLNQFSQHKDLIIQFTRESTLGN